MKNTDIKEKIKITEDTFFSDSIEFSDVIVYNEMTDQTLVRLNLIEQINLQLNQFEEISQKRKFMLKEVLQHIID